VVLASIKITYLMRLVLANSSDKQGPFILVMIDMK